MRFVATSTCDLASSFSGRFASMDDDDCEGEGEANKLDVQGFSKAHEVVLCEVENRGRLGIHTTPVDLLDTGQDAGGSWASD